MIQLISFWLATASPLHAQCIDGAREVLLPARRVHDLLAEVAARPGLSRVTAGGEGGCVVRIGAPDDEGRFEVELAQKVWRLNVERQTFLVEGFVEAQLNCAFAGEPAEARAEDVLSLGRDSSRSFYARLESARGFVQVPREKVTAYYAPAVLRCGE